MSVTLHTLGSNSSGNCYILTVGEDKLIIELGVRWKDILAATGYNLKSISGCITTHCHVDHSRSIPNALAYGLDVYSTAEVVSRYPKVKAMEPMKRYEIGNFKVLPLSVEHNTECYAYVIDHPDMGRLVFATDCTDFPYEIPDVTATLIEVNFCEDTIVEHACDGTFANSRPGNHMSLDRSIGAVRRLYNPRLMFVGAIHLSDSNSDENLIKRRFKEELGVDIRCLDAGDVVTFDKDEF